MPPRLAVRDIAFFERPVRFARPFRFGAVVVNAASQVFVRVEIEVEGKRARSVGASAEMMVPKWFDKRPHLSPEQTVDELRRSLADRARALSRRVTASRPRSACMPRASRRRSRPARRKISRRWRRPLVRPRSTRRSWMRCCVAPASISLTAWPAISPGSMRGCRPILRTKTSRSFSRRLPPARSRRDPAYRRSRRQDRRRGRRRRRHENAGARYFKLKLNGDPEHDAARLTRIGSELATLPHDYSVTLDANEQYADLAALGALVDRLDRDAALAPIATKLLYIEQPMPRDITRPRRSARSRPAISSSTRPTIPMMRFSAARALGYRGISSKSCKGIYKSIINATRAAKWSTAGEKYFITGEDLTCQAGLARAAGSRARRPDRRHPCRAQRSSLCRRLCRYAGRRSRGLSGRASRSLRDDGNKVRLAIHDGDLLTGSLTAPGFATGVHPDGRRCRRFNNQKQKSCRSNRYDDATPRRDHERGHRPHGAEPASDPLDRRDPRFRRRAGLPMAIA